ncbi:hypothetical protein I317_07670 [Kwoniella heveanensis CBS 569]|nr:hypothetical protein I317_07670 [Kwoniella heveanensis CBS 569]
MSVTSPVSASPGVSLLDWDEGLVQSYLSDLGLGKYEDVIYEHGITGDVLSVMDHAALQDLGINSLGHRLNLLRAVWELKKEQGIEFGEDDWRPQDAEEGEKVTQTHVDRLWDLIMDQHDRLIHLEREQNRMLSALEENGIPLPVPAPGLASAPMHVEAESQAHVQGIPGMEGARAGLGRNGSLRWKNFGDREKGSDVDEPEAGPSRTRRASTLFPSSLASSTNSNTNAPVAPLTSDTPTFQDSFTPTTVGATYPFDSPLAGNKDKDRDKERDKERSDPHHQLKPSSIQPPPLTRLLSGSAIMGSGASSPPGQTPPAHASTSSKNSLAPPLGAGAVAGAGPSPTSQGSSSSNAGPSDKAKSQANIDARSAAKSFRVTLDDPCWKVLPAALKKYKINDDWKLYALFICFDNTERCLSYDEKPLLLFQKLKETGHRPVFMLRHIKDIRSPIAVAQQKQAQKLGLPANSTQNVLPKIKPSTDTSISPTKANSLQPAAGNRADDGHTPNGGAFPELPSPGLRDPEGSAGGSKLVPPGHGSAAQPGSGTGTLVDKDGNVQTVTYAVAIYPYIADRQDEFDVAVGSTYIILSKAKGWYIVARDPDGLGVPSDATQGWVPAGCLLELSQPISLISPTPTGEVTIYPGLSPIPPSSIISSSYAGNVLMDYEAKEDTELSLKEGDRVRVYKKYCHWSYTIRSETGERGWVPAWFVGKSPFDSTATSVATTPTPSQIGAGTGTGTGAVASSGKDGLGGAGSTDGSGATVAVGGIGSEERLKDDKEEGAASIQQVASNNNTTGTGISTTANQGTAVGATSSGAGSNPLGDKI